MASPAHIIPVLEGISHASIGNDEVVRRRICTAARQMLSRLETPFEQAWGFGYEHPVILAALQTCVDLGIWDAWAAAGGGQKTTNELIELANHDVEPNLLRRLFRLLAAFNVVEETAEDTFKPTPFSHAIGDKLRASIESSTNQFVLACHNLPKHLAKINYKEPSAAEKGNHAESDPEGLGFFERLQKNPKYHEAFASHMENWTSRRTPWTRIYDPKKLLDGVELKGDSPLVVDVGGNTGVDVSYVLDACPDLPAGVLILQDLAEVIPHAKVDKKITTMAHDFFQPQPVKGSRAYFMHAVLHNWPDAKAIEILQHIREAMTRGYSKLFICDVVVPPVGASTSQTAMDVMMMSILSASERTESAWGKLLASAGLRVAKFWPDSLQYETLIEAEIA